MEAFGADFWLPDALSQDLVCLDDAAFWQVAPPSLLFHWPRLSDSSYAAVQSGGGTASALAKQP